VGAFAAGAVVLVRFPFSDLSAVKLRPALVVGDVGRGDYILCQITSKAYGDGGAVEIARDAFASGSLRVTSYVRPTKLFTANHDLINSQLGTLKPVAVRNVVQRIMDILRKAMSV